MEVFHIFNRGWKDTDGLIFCLRSCKRKMNEARMNEGRIDRNYIIESLRTLFLMIPYSRDLYLGKGERDLSYRMIYAWYQVFPILAIKALHMLFDKTGGDGGDRGYGYIIGSWCDVKYFCLFIEKISSYGLYDPLISIMIRLANRQLKRDLGFLESNVAKWIVRECNHPELFSFFVQDWFRKDGYVENKKKKYRKIVSGLSSKLSQYEMTCSNMDFQRVSNLRCYKAKFSAIVKKKILRKNSAIQRNVEMPSIDIGLYVRFVVEGVILQNFSFNMPTSSAENVEKNVEKNIEDNCLEELVSWIDHEWKKLMKTFPMGSYIGIAIVDLDLTIDREALYNSLGFACLIAMKMKTNRILLAGSIPICIDISECNGFCSMIQLLWGYCENRGKSSISEMGFVLKEAVRLVVPSSDVLRLFIFSDKLTPSWILHSQTDISNNKKCSHFFDHVDIVFWDVGSGHSGEVDVVEKDIIYMAGFNSGLIRPFFDENIKEISDDKRNVDKNCFLSGLLKRQYTKWNDFFDEFMNKIV